VAVPIKLFYPEVILFTGNENDVHLVQTFE
jgi:hypothetical protein